MNGIVAVIVYCVGAACGHSVPEITFDTVAQCQRTAPMIAGMATAGSPSARAPEGFPYYFDCRQAGDGTVLYSYQSAGTPVAATAARQ